MSAAAKYYISGCAFSVLTILAIAFGCMIPGSGSDKFSVPGTLIAIDSCSHVCWATTPARCIYTAYVTLKWNYNDTGWLANNVSTSDAGCSFCCEASVNKTVSVAIDKDKPWIVYQFWLTQAVPPPSTTAQRETYITLTSVFAILAFCAATCICAIACVDSSDSSSSKTDTKGLITRGH